MLACYTTARRELKGLDPKVAQGYRSARAMYDRQLSRARRELNDWLLERKRPYIEKNLARLDLSASEKELLRRPPEKPTPDQKMVLKKYGKRVGISDKELRAVLDAEAVKQWDMLAAAIMRAEAGKPAEPLRTLVLAGSGPGQSFYLERGDPGRESRTVQPGFLAVLSHAEAKHWSVDKGKLRAAFASWLTDVEQGAGALTARVMVNRLWQQHFGEGIVRTPSDFGFQGDRPTHPELLDWLAVKLIAEGWRLKPIHRLLVTSAIYRQGTEVGAASRQADPNNRLWSRRRPIRLQAEGLRDALLVASGSLNPQLFGPGIKPWIPSEAILVFENKYGETWPRDVKDGPATWRRSLYIFKKRSNPVPFLQVFDGPDGEASCARRTISTVAPQALMLLNDPFVRDQAVRFARRVRAEAGHEPAAQVRRATEVALGRPPASTELDDALAFFARQTGRVGVTEEEVLADFCQVLFSLNEFIYID